MCRVVVSPVFVLVCTVDNIELMVHARVVSKVYTVTIGAVRQRVEQRQVTDVDLQFVAFGRLCKAVMRTSVSNTSVSNTLFSTCSSTVCSSIVCSNTVLGCAWFPWFPLEICHSIFCSRDLSQHFHIRKCQYRIFVDKGS